MATMMPTSTLIRRVIDSKATNIIIRIENCRFKQNFQALPLPSTAVVSHPVNNYHSSSTFLFSRGVRSISGCNNIKSTIPYRSHLSASAPTTFTIGGTTSHYTQNLPYSMKAIENVNIVSNVSSSSLFSTTTTNYKNTTAENPSKPQYQYIHPLSQIVLEHLQSRHTSWVQKVGLDEGLKLNEDGTFVLRFPGDDDTGAEKVDDHDAKRGEDGVDESNIAAKNGSIWTMYEPEEKKHYLCVTKGNLVGRYMLQDNKKPAWHSDRRSTPERVQDAVDEMICKLDEMGA